MTRSKRDLYVAALDVLLKGRIASVIKAGEWDVLREVARLAQDDAPLALSKTDPALFSAWRTAVSRFHMSSWTNMTPDRVDAVRAEMDRTPDETASPLHAA